MDTLNKAQKQAVTTLSGPILVVAGAGTGKTRVLEYRTLELVKKGVDPRSILLLTFTRRAAAEMLARAARHDVRCRDVSGGTFHSFSLEMLKRYGKLVGLSSFTVLDRADSEDIVAKVVSDLKLREKKYFPKKGTITDIISKSSNKDIPIELTIENEYPHLYEWRQAIELTAIKYQLYKRAHKFLDFDDLLLEFYKLITTYEGVRTKIQQKYQFIMVDEFQDTNKLQGKIVQALASGHENILIVGDEMQSIYKFRGAEFANMMNFPKQFAATQKITLETNYRSTQEILDVANEVLDQVEGESFKKYLTSEKSGSKPQYRQFKSQQLESAWIADKVLELVRQGIELKEIAVLTRSSYQTAPLEIELASRSIPFKKYGGIRFVETAHVKDVTAHLKAVINPADEIAWRRIVLLLEGIGDKGADTIIAALQSLRAEDPTASYLDKAAQAIPKIHGLVELLKLISDEGLTVSQKIADIVEYYKPILRGNYDDFPQREQDLDALIEIASNYDAVAQFLNDIALDPPDQSALNGLTEDGDHMSISTIHSAKGLEWHCVFVLQLQDGKFPIVRDNTKQDDIEEERRLFYVAVTRAKEHLFLTSSHGRSAGMYESWFFTRPSRFVEPLLTGDVLTTHMIAATPFGQKSNNPYRFGKYDIDTVDVDEF